MENKKLNRHILAGLIAGISVGVFVIGGSVAWWALQSLRSSHQVSLPNIWKSQPSDVTKAPLDAKGAQIYWLQTSEQNLKLVPMPVTVEQSASPDAMLESIFKRLLSGSSKPELVTTIPQDTKLLAVRVEKNGIYVNLSQDFTLGGGSESMIGRLGQVIYTATSLDTSAPVWISVDGEPLTALGGEGVEVSQPMTRQQFRKNFPVEN